MKKTLISLTAIVTLAGLANADVIRSEATGLIAGDRIMTVEAAQQCWQEQMEKLFTDFEPQRKGTPLWQPIARPIAKFQALTAKSTTSMQWEALVARPVWPTSLARLGAGDEIRTHDPHVGNVMLYH